MPHDSIDLDARRRLAFLARRLAVGAITNDEFEGARPHSRDMGLQEIYFHGIWPLYSDLERHRLTGRWALTRAERRAVARIVLFLRSGRPYRYPRLTGLRQLPAALLSVATLGRFGRYWRRRQWRGGDLSVWPFHSRGEYEAALRHPTYLHAPST